MTSSGGGDVNISAASVTVGSINVSGGSVEISAGTTNVSGEISIAQGGTFSVSSGATITATTYTSSDGDTGVLTIDGDMTVSGEMTLSSGYDTRITGSGSLTAGSLVYNNVGHQGADSAEHVWDVDVQNLSLGTLTISQTYGDGIVNDVVRLSGSGEYGIGLIQAIGTANSANFTRQMEIAEGTTVNAGRVSIVSKLDDLTINGELSVSANYGVDGSVAASGSVEFFSSDAVEVAGSGKLTADSILNSGGLVTISVSDLSVATLSHTASKLLTISSESAKIGSLNMNGSGAVSISSDNVTIEVVTNNSGQAFTISSDVKTADIGTLRSTGAGAAVVAAEYAKIGAISSEGTGAFTISATTADIGSISMTGDAKFTITSDSAEIASVTNNTGRVFEVAGENSVVHISGDVSSPSGALVFGGKELVVDGNITMAGGHTFKIAASDKAELNSLTLTGGQGTSVISSAEFKVGDMTVGSSVPLTVSSESADFGTLTVSGAGKVLLSSENLSAGELHISGSTNKTIEIDSANATMGAITVSNDLGAPTATSTLTIDAGSVVNAGTVSIRAQFNSIVVDGTLTVGSEYYSADSAGSGSAGSFDYHTSYNTTVSGSGVLNAETLNTNPNDSNRGGTLTISVAEFNVGAIAQNVGSIQIGSAVSDTNAYGTKVGIYGDSNSLVTEAAMALAGTTTFAPDADQAMAFSGRLSGTGVLAKIGEGTLTLSGANTYTGGTAISEGKVVAGNNKAFGSGEVAISNGAQLQLDSSAGSTVTISNNIKITLTEANMRVARTDGVATFAANADSAFVITGEGVLESAIEISVDQAVLSALADEGVYEFTVIDTTDITWNSVDSLTLSKDLISAGYGVSSTDNGILTIVAVPEPSMFGIVAGLGTLALAATRRRRNRKA